MSDGQPARPREWWFTQLTLFIWAWMLIAPRLQDRWLVQLLLQVLLLNAVLMTLRVNPEWRTVRSVVIGLWSSWHIRHCMCPCASNVIQANAGDAGAA